MKIWDSQNMGAPSKMKGHALVLPETGFASNMAKIWRRPLCSAGPDTLLFQVTVIWMVQYSIWLVLEIFAPLLFVCKNQ